MPLTPILSVLYLSLKPKGDHVNKISGKDYRFSSTTFRTATKSLEKKMKYLQHLPKTVSIFTKLPC